MENQVQNLEIEKLLTENNYLIPIYQRDYAWEAKEINQLIQDFWDYAKEKNNSNYYIGTLVTHLRTEKDKEHIGKYEVLDGQQRLTTLYILVAALKSLGQDISEDIIKPLNLNFEAREESTNTLKNILDKKIEEKEKMQSIIDGFNIAKNYLETEQQDKSKIDLKDFTNYLLKNVILVRTIVPPDTDLNHYFEIMNNRGEQLEKHEILKANLLEKIDENERTQYAKVWDACSQMDNYVQMNFDSGDREKLFDGNWDSLNIEKISEIQKTGDNEKDGEDNLLNLLKLFDNEKPNEEEKKRIEEIKKFDSDGKEVSERFESIIDFPHFLLQVLKVTKGDVSLDDKKLLDKENGFYKFKENSDFKEDGEFAKNFIQNLLKYRFWFDKYVIKRENKENWSLQKLKYENNNQSYVGTFGKSDVGINKEITMIQSMFHVSNPSRQNKTWLNKVFEKCYCEKDLKESKEPKDFLNELEKISRELFTQKEELENLNYINNRPTAYTFNLLDYVIWKNKETYKSKIENINSFSFKFRNSVEHFYAQNYNPTEKDKKLKNKDLLHSFGNLALTSGGHNSKLSDVSPKGKKDKTDEKEQSLKFQLMLSKAENWNDEAIQSHQEEMIKLLKNFL